MLLQVKALVQRALQTAPVTPIPPADRQPLPNSSMAIPASVAAAAQRVMSHVFDACLQVRSIPWPPVQKIAEIALPGLDGIAVNLQPSYHAC